VADRQRQKDFRVHYSHGKGDLPDRIMHKIRGQLKLSEKDFKDLVACPLTYEGYLHILKRKGLL
jgi:hypothetical protein